MTAHIWDFGILADINKFPEAMQRDNHLRETAQIMTRNVISELDVSERNTFQTTENQHDSMDRLQCTDVLKHMYTY